MLANTFQVNLYTFLNIFAKSSKKNFHEGRKVKALK